MNFYKEIDEQEDFMHRRMTTNVMFIIILTIVVLPKLVAGQTGNGLYEQKCGRCHVAFHPNEYDSEDWPGIVRSMKAQSGLTQDDMDQLIDYLQSESDGRKTEGLSKRPVLGGYLYTEYFRTPEKAKNFDIHYLAVYISGWATDKIYYFGEFELEHGGVGGYNTFVEQAYIDYWFTPNIALKIGALLTPFNRFDEFHDPLSNYIITRPQVSREIGVSAWKDVGADLHGYFNLSEKTSLSFDLYTINGLGDGTDLRHSRQYRDNNEDLAMGGRLNLMVGDMLEIGGSVYSGAWDDDGKYNLNMMGSHLMLHTSFFDLYGEYAKATSENPDPADDGDMSGYFVQASKLIGSHFRPTIRYGALDYLDTGDLLGRSIGKGNKDVKEIAIGLTYYPTNKVAFKVEYTLFKEGDRIVEKDNDQLGFQAAIRF